MIVGQHGDDVRLLIVGLLPWLTLWQLRAQGATPPNLPGFAGFSGANFVPNRTAP
jgi:hypothetical protein